MFEVVIAKHAVPPIVHEHWQTLLLRYFGNRVLPFLKDDPGSVHPASVQESLGTMRRTPWPCPKDHTQFLGQIFRIRPDTRLTYIRLWDQFLGASFRSTIAWTEPVSITRLDCSERPSSPSSTPLRTVHPPPLVVSGLFPRPKEEHLEQERSWPVDPSMVTINYSIHGGPRSVQEVWRVLTAVPPSLSKGEQSLTFMLALS